MLIWCPDRYSTSAGLVASYFSRPLTIYSPKFSFIQEDQFELCVYAVGMPPTIHAVNCRYMFFLIDVTITSTYDAHRGGRPARRRGAVGETLFFFFSQTSSSSSNERAMKLYEYCVWRGLPQAPFFSYFLKLSEHVLTQQRDVAVRLPAALAAALLALILWIRQRRSAAVPGRLGPQPDALFTPYVIL